LFMFCIGEGVLGWWVIWLEFVHTKPIMTSLRLTLAYYRYVQMLVDYACR